MTKHKNSKQIQLELILAASLILIISFMLLRRTLNHGQNVQETTQSIDEQEIATLQVDGQKLPTPELIYQAFENGEITKEQQLLYIWYAFKDYEKLPDEYKGNEPWRGTMYLLDFDDDISDPLIFCSLTRETQAEFRQVYSQIVPDCK